MIGQRIVVVGVSGSGKTTLARNLADCLDLDPIELDRLFWLSDWQQRDDDDFRDVVRSALADDGWVVDGNYSRAREVVWPRADTVIWLDYPLWLILWRLFWRTIRRIVMRENLWGTGNRESFFTQFFGRDSLFLWAINTYHRRRREYPILFKQPEYAHLTVIHLKFPRQTQSWFETVTHGKC